MCVAMPVLLLSSYYDLLWATLIQNPKIHVLIALYLHVTLEVEVMSGHSFLFYFLAVTQFPLLIKSKDNLKSVIYG